jgi:hypothetical protein
MTLETELSLYPGHFFNFALECNFHSGQEAPRQKKYQLPFLGSLLGESDPFVNVYMSWNQQGIAFTMDCTYSFKQSSYPQINKGDAIELFIDTRDVKTAGLATRFCHHFYFLAHAVDGKQKGEITQFRTEDSHPLCIAEDLQFEKLIQNRKDCIKIFIPTKCLHGYDPSNLPRLGFTYKIHRKNGAAQHFSVSSKDFEISQQPSLWSTLRLSK